MGPSKGQFYQKEHPQTCSYCNVTYLSKHTGNKRGKDFFCSSECNSSMRHKRTREDPIKRIYSLYNTAKSASRKKSLPFDLTLGYLEELWKQQNGCCLLSKEPFILHKGEYRNHPKGPSLDRIEPSKGYVTGNVRLITYHLNIALNEFGLDEFITLAKKVVG